MPCNNLTLLESVNLSAAGTTYGSAFECDYEELLVYLEITEQGAYTDETLDVTIQAKNPDDKYFDIGSFDQIGDQTVAILADGWYRIVLPVRWFGTKIRVKVTVAGTAVDYTLNITAHLKRMF